MVFQECERDETTKFSSLDCAEKACSEKKNCVAIGTTKDNCKGEYFLCKGAYKDSVSPTCVIVKGMKNIYLVDIIKILTFNVIIILDTLFRI